MSLQRCTLSWQAFTTCASHAMSTEKQEVGIVASFAGAAGFLRCRQSDTAVDEMRSSVLQWSSWTAVN